MRNYKKALLFLIVVTSILAAVILIVNRQDVATDGTRRKKIETELRNALSLFPLYESEFAVPPTSCLELYEWAYGKDLTQSLVIHLDRMEINGNTDEAGWLIAYTWPSGEGSNSNLTMFIDKHGALQLVQPDRWAAMRGNR